MKKVKLSVEEIWVFECPECGKISEEHEELDAGNIVQCEHCYKEFKVEEND